MKIRNFIITLISLFCFIGIGLSLSRQQSQRADQVLNNNGLSSPYYVYNSKKHQSIKSFIKYLNKNWSGERLQVHFRSKYNSDQILIWANYNLKSQPMANSNSRYFNKSDFQGTIPFAVISAETKENLFTMQNNRYLSENNHYFSVIGQLKKNTESPYRQTAYYLTTGEKQTTGKAALNNFYIVIDGLPKNDKQKVAHYLRASTRTVNYAGKYNKRHGISPTKKFVFTCFCIIVGLINSGIWATIVISPVSKFKIKSQILTKLFTNSFVRFFLVNTILFLGTGLILPLFNFYSDISQLFVLLGFLWLMENFTFIIVLLLSRRRRIEA
ncbi:hypothetical protein NR996_06280 [Lactobacillus rodentium]|uniref:MacB-like periplasmic core domain-containing protein n=1 Tax=Lactobacillus rodentium TaxID=947835 RepID=A0A2Z6T9M8_9LACO|nr:hypothetical protein [Lactobacillus rodentium]MCR1895017.1 hypothetical protein [Lactobacillus rodentium]GBG05318.1 hypothetical protein LrDSM24759_12320 [Lactobacillus rodentium]